MAQLPRKLAVRGGPANFAESAKDAEKIKKGKFKTGKLGGCNATMSELWNAALNA